MTRLVPKLGGPYFNFLVVAPDEFRKRVHPRRKTTHIKQQYFNHPDTLRVPDCVVGVVVERQGFVDPRHLRHLYRRRAVQQSVAQDAKRKPCISAYPVEDLPARQLNCSYQWAGRRRPTSRCASV